ncbi:diguanylate cyclase [Thiomicrorhabdus sp. zzn3]|uniref:diguanylate cyclase n=1 Tax=Thiomicrorhabdus sp. zzn3 TaxID=3039775 RepID=UPI00243745D0|nr:diguanylate cyclase [Thiomicrorhabdus sp. zzn3]MDG6778114.1 diguanylate cyclase [Thiomicrorhabdus sp. zzn3]
MSKSAEKHNRIDIPSIGSIFALIVFLCAAGFGTNLYFSVQNKQTLYQSKLNMVKARVQATFQDSLELLNREFSFLVAHYGSMPAITQAIATRDRLKLYDLVASDYLMLKRLEPHLYVMHFFDPENITILRMHKPQSFDDDLTQLRPIVAYVNRNKKQASGFEGGKNGVTYRITTPMFDRNSKHIGALEFGIRPQYFVDALRQKFDIKSRILVKTDSLKNLSYETHFEKISDYSIIYTDDLFKQIKLGVHQDDEFVDYDDRTYLIISDVYLKTYDGRELVRFQILEDVTEFSEKHRYELQFHVMMNVALFSIFFTILYVIFNRYHRKLITAVQALKVSKKVQKEITHSSYRDELTHAYNRRYFNKIMTQLTEKGSEQAEHYNSVIFFDLDYFKKINDDYGHLVGDEILKSLSAFVRSRVRDDDLLFRWGGEEFCLLLQNTSLNEAIEKAEELRVKVAEHTWTNRIELTISIGVTEIRPDDSLVSLQNRLDALLYKAKASGRNRYISE